MAVPAEVMVAFVEGGPTGVLRRQAFFLYEWLTGRTLPVDPTKTEIGNYEDAIDAGFWHAGRPVNSPRHRIRNNLPGTAAFCPLVARSATLGTDLREVAERRVKAAVGSAGQDQVSRLARRLLMKDSKSTFQIENETPSLTLAQRWSEVLASAGRKPLSLDLLIGHQKTLMADRRFMVPGLRRAGVYLGDRIDESPVPTWVGARPEDLAGLMEGLVAANARMTSDEIDPLAQAAAVGFGMVFIHPFEDGNGRLHRYLLQHVLGERGITPNGVTLPISKAIWNDIDGYHRVLSDYDRPRMPLIAWKPTSNGNVEVTSDTADLYRYFDATEQTQYLISCMNRVFDHDIPDEMTEMRRRDEVVSGVKDILDMPDAMVDKFILLTTQNNGTLSKGKRKKEFSQLTDEEVSAMQDLVRETYEIEQPSVPAP